MVPKYTQQEFINAAKKIHGNKYNYEKVVYKALKDKVEIICPLHDSFWIAPTKHLDREQGCKQCSIDAGNYTPPHTNESFIEASIKVHGDKYNYSLVEYNGNKSKVSIICEKHLTTFEQKPNAHLLGRGCPECAKETVGNFHRGNTQDFIFQALLKHGNKYSYNKVEYESSQKKVLITCNFHEEDFWQDPSNHLQGAGCPKCGKSGYNRNKPGTFYILKDADITKVGITNVAVSKRLKQINNYSKRDFQIVHTQYFENGEDTLNLETIVLQHLRKNHKNPEQSFQGSTECFFDVNLTELLAFVSPLNRI